MKPWMDKWFRENVTSDRVEAMAWLIGFWIGDGYKRGATFALHSEDHDVNDYLRLSAGKLGMKLTITKIGETGFKAQGVLHTQDGCWNKHSPLTFALRELRFYEDGERDRPKSVPEFLRFETRSVKEYFMAGLIDSDGCTICEEGTYKACIKTSYQPIRDGILSIVHSLGLNVTVSFEPQRMGEDFNRRDCWYFNIFQGCNSSVFWSILNKCACDRKRNPGERGSCRPRSFALHDESSSLLKFKAIPLSDTNCGTGRVYAVFLKNSYDTFLTEEQLICAGAVLKKPLAIAKLTFGAEESRRLQNEAVIPDGTNFCFCCARTKDSGFEKIPWDPPNIWCETCRRRCNKSHGICENKECHWIASEIEVKKASPICVLCGSAVTIDSFMGYGPRPKHSGKCSGCYSTATHRWLRLPWDKKSCQRICRACYNKYKKTGKYCVHCCKTFGRVEVRLLLNSFTPEDGREADFVPCDSCSYSTNIRVEDVLK